VVNKPALPRWRRHESLLDVGRDLHRADALGQDEMDLALDGFLVALQARGERAGSTPASVGSGP
jgi:hypothetical protein